MPHNTVVGAGKEHPSPKRYTLELGEIQKQFSDLLDNDPKILDYMRDNGGHVVLNADDLFKRWPEYAENPTSRRWLGPLLYEVARNFIDFLFAKLLKQSPTTGTNVIFTAGGGASGKSTILRAQVDRPEVDFVVDTTFSDSARSIKQIDTALGAGRQVEINYVYRDFEDAVRGMIERALDPKVGRIVPIDDMARTHSGAQETVFAVIERYEEDPRVAVRLWESLPKNTIKPLSLRGLIARQLPEIDELQKLGQCVLNECFEEAIRNPVGQWKGLQSDRPFYEAARSKAQTSLAEASFFDPSRHEGGG
jgi:hypothetical protein